MRTSSLAPRGSVTYEGGLGYLPGQEETFINNQNEYEGETPQTLRWFLGKAGKHELLAAGPDAVQGVRESSGIPDKDWEQMFEVLETHGNVRACLFRCLHCGKYGGYLDCD